jgi:hypothetical protein
MPRTARPQKLGSGRWRIRWIDHTGTRRSRVFSDFGEAERALRAHQNATDEVRQGLRAAPPEDHTFDELADYYETHRLPTKRSARGDRSILGASWMFRRAP